MQLLKSSTLLVWLLSVRAIVPASAQYAAFRALDPAAELEMLADGAVLITPSSSSVRPGSGRAHTNFHLFHPAGGLPTANAANAAPPIAGNYNETPASIACLYALVPVVTGCNPQHVFAVPSGGGGVIAIVGANHAPNAMADLNVFSQNFGLPLVNPASFQVIYATSAGTTTSTPPSYDSGWEMEISLDVQWAHAMAPSAKIILVEANSANMSDMLAAVSLAGSLVTVGSGGQVSLSWGASEYFGEATNDSTFTGSKVVYFAATGDSPGTSYPAASPNVVAVGGTSISRNRTTGNFVSQSAWSSGGGPSRYEKRPSYQSSISRTVGSARGIPDVSAVADPNSGVWIYDSAAGGWIVVGGTSVATPVVAGITNLRGGGFSVSSNAEMTYIYGHQSDYTDITTGNCRTHRATTNWDFCTGAGVPKGH